MPKTNLKPIDISEFTSMIAPFDLEPVLAANQRSLQAAAEAQAHLLARMTRVNEELFAFVDRRLARDRECAKRFASCSTPQEAVDICAQFVQAAFRDYSEEAGVLAGLYAEEAREAMEDAQHQVETTIETADDAKPAAA